MSDLAAKLDILIDIQAKLNDLLSVQKGIRETKEESNQLGAMFRQGLGIGTGMSLATNAIGLFKRAVVDSIGEAFRLAEATKAIAGNLQMNIQAYQALSDFVKDADGSVDALVGALNQQRASMVQARDVTSSAASAVRVLGLDFGRLQGMRPERQFEAIAKAIAGAHDKEAAFSAATELLGERHVKNLRKALEELAEQGFDKVAASAAGAAKFMSPAAIAQLAALKKMLGDNWDKFVAKAGEDFASVSTLFFGQADVPHQPEKTGAEIQAAQTLLQQQQTLVEKQTALGMLQRRMDTLSGNPALDEDAKRTMLIASYEEEIRLLDRIIELRKAMPIAIERHETDIQRAEEIDKLQTARDQAVNAQRGQLGGGQRTNFYNTREAFRRSVNPSDPTRALGRNPALNASEGFFAGFMQWATKVGSIGEQLASSIEGTLGNAVQGVSQGIYGWITGTESFGQSMRQLGATVFQTMLNTIVQMGVQWIVTQTLVKVGMISSHTLGESLRAQRMAAAQAEGAANLAANTPGAAAASISSFGAAAIIGIVALVAALAMLGGFASGGYTGAGGKYEVAGAVHRGEVVIPSETVSRIGVPAAEDFAFGRTTPGLTRSSPVAASKPRVYIIEADTTAKLRAFANNPDWDAHVVGSVMRNRGDILNS